MTDKIKQKTEAVSSAEKDIYGKMYDTGIGSQKIVEQNEEMPQEAENASQVVVEQQDLQNNLIDDLQKRVDLLTRQLAETENTRKRGIKEAEDKVKYAITSVVEQLIEGLDLLFLATKSIPLEVFEQSDHLKNFFVGFEMTKKKFLEIMERNGVRRIEPIGQAFDHQLHQAVSMVASENIEDGYVVDVLQAGYVLHGRVIRPAMVTVSKGK